MPDLAHDCGCVESVHEPQVCDTHRTVVVVRDGAAARTGDELDLQYLEDAVDLFDSTDGAEHLPRWVDLRRQVGDDFAGDHGHGACAWLQDDDLRVALAEARNEAEDHLATLGYHTDTNDGYVIWAKTVDCPVEDWR